MVGWTFYISFSDWQGTAPNYNFAGLKWYQLMFKLDRFWVDIRNNIIYGFWLELDLQQ
jgi:ABC-type sugar transport system permease subunit